VSPLVYVYAVLPRPIASDIKGIDSRPVRWVVEDDLAAAVSDVPDEEFDEAPLNEHVRDLSWLGPRAIAHQEVNDLLHADGEAVVPLAFGTVFRDEDRVRQLLHDQRAALAARLEAVRGRAEWVVTLHALQEPDAEYVARASPAMQAARQDIAASTPGRAHLLKRRLAELERDERRRIEAESAQTVVTKLREIAADVYLEPLPTDKLERPLVRASVLVPRADETRFVEGVERLREMWPEPMYRLLLTGPWPPYRFGGLQPEHGQ
jgi:Gas vesicle synthesis protein GvpL/GvpF